MQGLEKLKISFERSRFLWLRYIPAAAICFIFAFMLMYAPKKASLGVTGGLEMCLQVVIPSLFPFLFVSSLMVTSGLHMKIGKFLRAPTRILFKQPAAAAPIILMSLIGGIPVGSRMAAQVYMDGQLTQNQAQRLCLFCINAGPAFVISAVGGSMLGSYKAGTLIYISLLISSLIAGVLTRFLCDSSEQLDTIEILPNPPTLVTSLTMAADSSARSMISVCIWIILFSCLTSLLEAGNISPQAKAAVCALCEVTTGCNDAAGVFSIPIVAGILGWSGLCAHCQVLSGILKLHINIRLFFTSRVLCGALSALICQWLLKLFPVQTAVFAAGTRVIARPFNACAPVTIGLLVMCALLLLGENFSIQKKSNG